MSIFNDTEIKKIENRKKLRVGAFKDSVGVESETMDMWWLFELWSNGKVDSLETFLQRPILEKIWKANDNQKCLEFLTSALKGTSLLEVYILAPASLVLDECKKWEKHETDKDVLAQLKECKDLVQKKIAKAISKEIIKDIKISMKNGSSIKAKLPVIPARGPKVSKQNLMASGLGMYTC